jgi:hypothetical protein
MNTYPADIYSKEKVSLATLLYRYRVPLVLMFISLWLLCFGGIIFQRAKDSVTWPTARGEIQVSCVLPRMPLGRGDHESYYAKVTYNFTVNETRYIGTVVGFDYYGSRSLSTARDIVNRYPKDAAVTVYYNPRNPQVCVLEPGAAGQARTWLEYGLVIMMLAIFAAVFIRVQSAKTEGNNTHEVIEICPPESVPAKSVYPESDLDTSNHQTQHSGRL